MELLFLKDEVKMTLRRRVRKIMKCNDWFAMILGLIGTLFAAVATNEYMIERPERSKNINSEDYVVMILRSVVTVTTLPLLVLRVRHHVYSLTMLKAREMIDYTETL